MGVVAASSLYDLSQTASALSDCSFAAAIEAWVLAISALALANRLCAMLPPLKRWLRSRQARAGRHRPEPIKGSVSVARLTRTRSALPQATPHVASAEAARLDLDQAGGNKNGEVRRFC